MGGPQNDVIHNSTKNISSKFEAYFMPVQSKRISLKNSEHKSTSCSSTLTRIAPCTIELGKLDFQEQHLFLNSYIQGNNMYLCNKM